MSHKQPTHTDKSTNTAGGDPIAGADPGGTHSTHPGQKDKKAPKEENPSEEQTVASGDRNTWRETRGPSLKE